MSKSRIVFQAMRKDGSWVVGRVVMEIQPRHGKSNRSL